MLSNALVLAASLALAPAAVQEPSIAGTWVMDTTRSDTDTFGTPGPAAPGAVVPRQFASERGVAPQQKHLVIELRDGDLTLRTELDAVSSRLDGIERTTIASATEKVKGWRNGGTVHIERTRGVTLPGGPTVEVTTRESFSRQADGGLLRERITTDSKGTVTRRFLYREVK